MADYKVSPLTFPICDNDKCTDNHINLSSNKKNNNKTIDIAFITLNLLNILNGLVHLQFLEQSITNFRVTDIRI